MILYETDQPDLIECLYSVDEVDLILENTSLWNIRNIKLLISANRAERRSQELISSFVPKSHLQSLCQELAQTGDLPEHYAPSLSPHLVEFGDLLPQNVKRCRFLSSQIMGFLLDQENPPQYNFDNSKL